MKTPKFSLKREHFPIKIIAYKVYNQEIVWTSTIEEPERGGQVQALAVPPLKRLHGCQIGVKMIFGDGEEIKMDSLEN